MTNRHAELLAIALRWREALESPIEQMLWDRLIPLMLERLASAYRFEFGHPGFLAAIQETSENIIAVSPQCELGENGRGPVIFRVDICLIVKNSSLDREQLPLMIAIECDGHDWHERTKIQARRDRSRDRQLARSGWIVQRFTGSEITADAKECAHELLDLISSWYGDDRLSHRLARFRKGLV
jgi:restriction endonuclease-like protein